MASITIRNLDEALKQRLRVRAAEHGHSMEQEARDILRVALAQTPQTGEEWLRSIRARFEKRSGTSNRTNWRSRLAARCARTASIRLTHHLPMIVLDTNVVSELVRHRSPDPKSWSGSATSHRQ